MGNSIPASNLVAVQPGVIGAGGSPLSLNAVFVTQNSALPIGAPVPFATLVAVQNYFGPGSTEANLASVYFGGFNGATQLPGTLYFVRYAASAVSAFIRGVTSLLTLAALQAIVPGVVTASAGASFTATGSGANLTTSAVTGVISVGDTISGTGIPVGTTILSQTSGTTGGAGVYVTSVATTASAASITATSSILQVTAVASGALIPGQLLTGTGVTAASRLGAQLSGTAGGIGTYSLSVAQQFASTAVTGAHDMSITIDGVAKSFSTINLSTATSFSAAASLIATALSLSGGQTCTWSSQFNAFVITSGTTGVASTIAQATGFAATVLGLGTGSTLSQGAATSTEAGTMSAVALATQNWVSFMTMWEPNLASKLNFAAWTNSQNQRYMYVCYDTDATAALPGNTTSFGPLMVAKGYNGIVPIYQDPMIAAFVCGTTASINFTQLNGRITYAFRGLGNLTASVTDPTTANNLIANGYNFYGSYATANTQFTMLQPGSTPGQWKWIDSYVNQIYLNNQLQLAGVTLLTSVNSLPFNTDGYTSVRNAFTPPIQQAINFGSIRAGVPLSSTQVAEVNMAAGVAIDQVLAQNGYYLQILPATAQTRGNRGPLYGTLWYMDGESIQSINLASNDVF